MVTDEQFKQLQKKVDALEEKIQALSMRLTKEMMHNDTAIPSNEIKALNEGKKDTTRYIFNGKQFGKRGLVLAVMKQYVSDHQIADIKELERHSVFGSNRFY